MSGRLARAAASSATPPPPPLRSFDFLASVGISGFRTALAARVLHKKLKAYTRKGTPIQSHPLLKDIGRGIEDHPTKRRFQQRVFKQTAKIMRDQFPHLTGKVTPFKKMPSPNSPNWHKQRDHEYPILEPNDRSIFVNLRPADKVRIIAGGVIPANSKWIKPKKKTDENDENEQEVDQVWEVSSVDPKKNTVKLEGVTYVQSSQIPKDRNMSTRPFGTFQESDKRDIQLEIPMRNVQLLIPRKAVIEGLKKDGLWTEEREKALPQQIFALALEERNIVPASRVSRIYHHERHGGLNPWEYILDETHVVGSSGELEPRLYTWERYATETSPKMDPRLRIDLNVPFAPVVARKRLPELTTPHPLATPSSAVLDRTWDPPPLSQLGPSLFFKRPDLPNAYLSSMASAAAHAQSYSLSGDPIPDFIPPLSHTHDAAFSNAELDELQAMHKSKVDQRQLERDAWTRQAAERTARDTAESIDATLPMEFFVSNELSNHWGKHKMALRYEARQRRDALEKTEFIDAAVQAHYDREWRIRRGEEPRVGRVMRMEEVRLTAQRRYAEMWVDRQHEYLERKKRELRERWGPSKEEAKKKKREIKKERLADQLRKVLLVPSKNQVIPEGLESEKEVVRGKRPGGEGRNL